MRAIVRTKARYIRPLQSRRGHGRIERDDDVLRVTLARPETRNAFDASMIAELAEAFVDVGTARAVVLAGEGASFCAGADIDWMRASVDLSYDENVAEARPAPDAGGGRHLPRSIVTLVQGHAFGGGAGLVACADIVLAHERTVFAFSEVKVGIVPAVISPFALRKIGVSAARRYFVTGERFDAMTALRIRLVHEVTDDLDAALERVLVELRTAGPRAARHAKRLVRNAPTAPRRHAASPSAGRARKGRKAFVRSSRGARRRGRHALTRDGAARAALRRDDRRGGLPGRHHVAARACRGRRNLAGRRARHRHPDRARISRGRPARD